MFGGATRELENIYCRLSYGWCEQEQQMGGSFPIVGEQFRLTGGLGLA